MRNPLLRPLAAATALSFTAGSGLRPGGGPRYAPFAGGRTSKRPLPSSGNLRVTTTYAGPSTTPPATRWIITSTPRPPARVFSRGRHRPVRGRTPLTMRCGRGSGPCLRDLQSLPRPRDPAPVPSSPPQSGIEALDFSDDEYLAMDRSEEPSSPTLIRARPWRRRLRPACCPSNSRRRQTTRSVPYLKSATAFTA